MGRSIYLSEKEILALIDASTEWVGMMMNGGVLAMQEAEDRLNNGLGRALKNCIKDAGEKETIRIIKGGIRMDNQEICEALEIIKNVCKETKLKHKDDCAIPCMMCPLGNYHGDCCIVGTDPEGWDIAFADEIPRLIK